MENLPNEIKAQIYEYSAEKNPNLITELHKYFYYHQYEERFEKVFRCADMDEEGYIIFYDN